MRGEGSLGKGKGRDARLVYGSGVNGRVGESTVGEARVKIE